MLLKTYPPTTTILLSFLIKFLISFCFLSLFFFFLFWDFRVEFVIKCDHQQSLLLCAVSFKVQRNIGFILFHLQLLHFFSCRFCVKFTETLASCSSKVMCLKGCVSLSPDCIYHWVVCLCNFWTCLNISQMAWGDSKCYFGFRCHKSRFWTYDWHFPPWLQILEGGNVDM